MAGPVLAVVTLMLCGAVVEADFISEPGVVARMPDFAKGAVGLAIDANGIVYARQPGEAALKTEGQAVQSNTDMYAHFVAFGGDNTLFVCNSTSAHVTVPTTGTTAAAPESIAITGGTCAGLSVSNDLLHVLVNDAVTSTQSIATYSATEPGYPILYEVQLPTTQSAQFDVLGSNRNRVFLGSSSSQIMHTYEVQTASPTSAHSTFELDSPPTAVAASGDMLCSASATSAKCYAMYTSVPLVASSASAVKAAAYLLLASALAVFVA